LLDQSSQIDRWEGQFPNIWKLAAYSVAADVARGLLLRMDHGSL
jgi:hypothetical protein